MLENVYVVKMTASETEPSIDMVYINSFQPILRIFQNKDDAEAYKEKVLKNLKENPKEFVFEFDKPDRKGKLSCIEDMTTAVNIRVDVVERKLF